MKITKLPAGLTFLLLLIFISSCNHSNKPKPDTSIPPKYANQKEPTFNKQGVIHFLRNQTDTLVTLNIEIADTPQKREKGLMHRRSMEDNQSMLFIFDKEERQSFWMKDTHIALDILFINEAKTVVHMAENCQPYSLKSIPSFEYALYVFEANAGFAEKNEVKVGDKISFVRF
ncbi:MAG: DUF192 domain-containing protein [Salinivirgaceae bacterium]